MLQWVLLGIGITIVLGYSFFALKGFVEGPRIELATPMSGFSTTTPVIEVSGRALRTSVFTLNDSPIPLDLQGNFNEHIVLALGYNVLSVKAEDRYKRSTEQKLEIILLPTLTETATSTATTTPETATTTDELIN